MPEDDSTPPKKTRLDLYVKLGFLAVGLAIAVTVWWFVQLNPNPFPEWEKELEPALTDAKADGRPVLILFHSWPMDETTRWLAKYCFKKPQSAKVFKDLQYVRIHIETEVGSEVAETYEVKSLPTMIVLDREGKILRRHEGKIAEAVFYSRFLKDGLAVETQPASRPATTPAAPAGRN